MLRLRHLNLADFSWQKTCLPFWRTGDQLKWSNFSKKFWLFKRWENLIGFTVYIYKVNGNSLSLTILVIYVKNTRIFWCQSLSSKVHFQLWRYTFLWREELHSAVEKKNQEKIVKNFSCFFGLKWCLKGKVSRDFRLLVFFMNQFPPIP